jgi:hypothetical protein
MLDFFCLLSIGVGVSLKKNLISTKNQGVMFLEFLNKRSDLTVLGGVFINKINFLAPFA